METSLEVQWLGLCASTAGDLGSIPDQGTKIPYAIQKKEEKKKKYTIHLNSFITGIYFSNFMFLRVIQSLVCIYLSRNWLAGEIGKQNCGGGQKKPVIPEHKWTRKW